MARLNGTTGQTEQRAAFVVGCARQRNVSRVRVFVAVEWEPRAGVCTVLPHKHPNISASVARTTAVDAAGAVLAYARERPFELVHKRGAARVVEQVFHLRLVNVHLEVWQAVYIVPSTPSLGLCHLCIAVQTKDSALVWS
jgi:hypothetical protein